MEITLSESLKARDCNGILKLLKTSTYFDNITFKSLPYTGVQVDNVGVVLVPYEGFWDRLDTDSILIDCVHCAETAIPVCLIVRSEVELLGEVANIKQFYNRLHALSLAAGCQIVFCPEDTLTAKLYSLLSILNDDKIRGLPKPKKSFSLQAKMVHVLCSLPGIGPQRATKLLQQYGCPTNVFTVLTTDVQRVLSGGVPPDPTTTTAGVKDTDKGV